jgi:hypothetical protein
LFVKGIQNADRSLGSVIVLPEFELMVGP